MLKFAGKLVFAAAILVSAMAAQAEDGASINLFDGETLFGWNAIGTAEWEVDDGAIECRGGAGGFLATTSQFKNFELSLSVKLKDEASTGIVVRGGLEGHHTENGSSYLVLREKKGSDNAWKNVVITAKGSDVSATVDGKKVDIEKGTRDKGYICLQFHHNNNAKVEFKDIKLSPLSLDPIFDGKTLDGWNILPDKASKFSVVDGSISIKDGNGQIETDAVFKDFVLQLDIISNGEHLNSGVFIRGPKGIFWKGYESQVRNQWRGDDRTKPVDYGTGGNYGNQNTRKVIPSDGEWFTKTVVADGNHTAVWINGHQVSDFIDTRAPSRNSDGKAGYVGDAGTIHLQGHDPTTDLNFKNIMVQEY